MFNALRNLTEDEHGATLVEYSLVVMLISAVAIAVLSALGNDVAGIFSKISAAVQPAP